MKTSWRLLLLILSITATCHSVLKCQKHENCVCIPGQELEFHCPKSFEDDKKGFVVHVKEFEQLQIDCHEVQFDESILPNITLNEIFDFRIKRCQLPKHSFQEILKKFAIKKLQLLDFGGCNLANTTLSKDYFVGLGQLIKIKLNSNNLYNLEDDVFSNTPNLVSLELQGNQIQLKPNLFKYTPFLKSLDLSENRLFSIPKGTFRALPKLERLHLWDNDLSTLDEFTFEGLFNLVSLELSANKIESIAENTFHNLTNLTQINLSKNQIKNIPPRLFSNNQKLKLIRISGNKIKMELADQLFSNLPELRYIILTNCKISAIPDQIFENSTNLQEIVLADNSLVDLPRNLFKALQNLEEINLNNNKIQNISKIFASLKKLKKLSLRNNAITEIGDGAFWELDSLEDIDLSINGIKKIHSSTFAYKRSLRKINLSNNLYVKTENCSILEGANNLVYVDFSYNKVTQIADVIVLDNKVDLLRLDLSYNRITDIRLKELQPLTKKLFIDLQNNEIATVDFQSILEGGSPSMIDLSMNPINCDCSNYDLLLYLKHEISPEVKKLFHLTTVILECNKPPKLQDTLVKDVDPLLVTCPLEKLTNGYTGCPDGCSCSWRPRDRSLVIDCAEKNFTRFPEIYVTPDDTFPFNQTELHLQKNSLGMGPNSNLTGYENVTRLYLSYNKINDIFWLPPKLKDIHLDNNNLKTLGYKILSILNASESINLTLNNNPWMCNCEADNLTDFLRHHLGQVDAKTIFCFNTTTLLVDLNRSDLCNEWQTVYAALLVMLLLLLLTITLALYYRYQEEIEAWLWIHNWCPCFFKDFEDSDKDKIYDAFISFSQEDEDFVAREFLPELKVGPISYNLCLYGKNWAPGELIIEQITTSVLESKRTIVILSPNLLGNVWGLMEFRTAHTQAMTDGRVRVIIVLYGDLDMDKLDPELKMYLKTNTYVKWGDPFFWTKLKYALPHHTREASKCNVNQKHSNIMKGIGDKSKLVAPATGSPGSTPPVLSLSPALLKDHPLNFVSSPELA